MTRIATYNQALAWAESEAGMNRTSFYVMLTPEATLQTPVFTVASCFEVLFMAPSMFAGCRLVHRIDGNEDIQGMFDAMVRDHRRVGGDGKPVYVKSIAYDFLATLEAAKVSA